MPQSGHPDVIIIGGGLAGADAAWQAAMEGARVLLYEMRPVRRTPAHQTGNLAELVCSNSLKSNQLITAAGMLKHEMRLLGSVVIASADRAAVPSGGALSVDRDLFAAAVTAAIEGHPRITVVREEVTEIPDGLPVVIATGPLTSDALAAQIQALTGTQALYFYDAASPIVDAETINRDIAWEASRYDKGEPEGYLNCPFTEAEYHRFREELLKAERVPLKDFEPIKLFEGCLPIEELAQRGELTLAYGPLKPVGLRHPRTGGRPFAVAQLRRENRAGTLYSLVGFQTRLTWPEQRRIFRTIPGLENATFVRLGVMHRNTYLNSPALLEPTLALRRRPNREASLFFAGQITGVEGYVESAATGILVGINAARAARAEPLLTLPPETMLGALVEYIAHGSADNFQPMNANLGVLPPLVPNAFGMPRRREERHRALTERGLRKMAALAAAIGRAPAPATAAA
ncbi:MAG: FADH(2)-oxidizing methylenetetrahydrofolate--tRNA-(uracil(54)-C(5))-methyltransferase TrmFO [Armatimonadetes bacterium]|nr:FADH(2)-oxidizing methylenetetrahydrofolate--tRNA-(uracil(54)-C(5))-methyltransferase TrmFO [Armatimonadota bacterium]